MGDQSCAFVDAGQGREKKDEGRVMNDEVGLDLILNPSTLTLKPRKGPIKSSRGRAVPARVLGR